MKRTRIAGWLCGLLGVLWLSASAVKADRAEAYAPGEVLVGMLPEHDNPRLVQQRVAEVGSIGRHTAALHLYRIQLKPGISVPQAIERLRHKPGLRYVEPNGYLRLHSEPNDTLYKLQKEYLAPLGIEQAWSIWRPKRKVVIAIVDTGVNGNHPDLINKVDAGYDAVNNQSWMDTDGHGTQVAGIAAAQINNSREGIAGIAGWNGNETASDTQFIRILPIKVFLNAVNGTIEEVAKGINWAVDHGATVLNLSFSTLNSTPSKALEVVVQYAWESGCVVVASAGNNGNTALQYPAAYPHVISVAATDSQDLLLSNSTYGTWVQVAAPGSGIYSTSRSGDYDEKLSGTSFAAPHVAGEAALLMSHYPAMTNAEAATRIVQCVDPITPYPGKGGIRPGGGRINIYRALKENKVPVARDDSATVSEDSSLLLSPSYLLENDTDPDKDPLQIQVQELTKHGKLEVNAAGDFVYTPEKDFNGTDTFTYRLFDCRDYSNTATVTLTVLPRNDKPLAKEDTYLACQNKVLTVLPRGVLANDFDIDGDPLTTQLETTTQHGTLNLREDGGFIYTPHPGFTGEDSFTYIAKDGQADSEKAKVTLQVYSLQLTVTPPTLCGGQEAQGRITLDRPLAASASFALTTNAPASIQLPMTVTLPAGEKTIPFIIKTRPVAQETVGYLTATRDTLTASQSLTLKPWLKEFQVTPASVCGLLAVQGTVRLECPAPPGGLALSFTSSNPQVVPLLNRTVPAGTSELTFPIRTLATGTTQNVHLTVSDGTAQQSTDLEVQPLLAAFTVTPAVVCGTFTATGTITLHCPLPPEDSVTLLLESNQGRVVTVPRTLALTPGETQFSFPIQTNPLTALLEATLSVGDGAGRLTAQLRVTPASLYRLKPLGTLGGQNSYATGINAKGQVVGYSETLAGDTHAFRYDNGPLTDLLTLGGQHSYAYGIHDTGDVVGTAQTLEGDLHATLFHPNGTLVDLLTLGGPNSEARAIGGSSPPTVVGFSEMETGETHAFSYKAELLKDLFSLFEGGNARAYGINTQSPPKIVGSMETLTGETHAFLTTNDVPQEIGTLGGANSTAYAVNNANQVVGVSEVETGKEHAFLSTPQGLTDLGTLGGSESAAFALNSQGHIVGRAQDLVGDWRPFIVRQGPICDLSALVTNLGDWQLTQATGINANGQIVGNGNLYGDNLAFLLQPLALRTITGKVNLEQCVNAVQTLCFELRSQISGHRLRQVFPLNADGTFTLKDVPGMPYTLAVKGYKWLRKTQAVNTTDANRTGLEILLLAGDANDDNRVDIFDLATLAAAFNTSPADPNWNEACDFNCDGSVDIFDLALLAKNFNTEGDL